MTEEIASRSDVPASIDEIMENAYLQYSLSVNIGRAIPDVRDGLKPGNRRILFAMRQLNLGKSHAYTKCAKVVGEVIGNYHPHGDQAVYDTLVRMAQDFSMRAPLIDGQGNFGSIDGDAAAAYRYTECRMERLAEELLADLDKNTVDMRPTFDEVTVEPEVLPARFPNLLVNGGTGIGVGMATNIPPHNLAEVIDATIHLIDNPTASPRSLMQFIHGPDFPTGATIMGIQPIIDLYETGHGIIKVRAKAEISEHNGRERIVITEIPYAVNKEVLVGKIARLVNEKRIVGISDINDESSSRAGIRIVVDIKRGAMATVVLNQLYAHTALENSYGCQFLVVDRNRPRIMTLPQVLQAYIDHREIVVMRRSRYELAKAEARAHIIEGLLTAVDHIDEVIEIIRGSRNREEAGLALQARFSFSDRQTSAILEMRLHQLTGLAREELQNEFDILSEQIKYYKELIADRAKLMAVIKTELTEVRDKYSDDRRTDIQPSEQEINIEDLIARQICVISISTNGYISRMHESTFRRQNRGGVGVMGMQTKDDDYVQHLLTSCSHDYILFFTNRGLMHWLKAYEIPEAGRTSRGKAMVNLLELEDGELIRAMITVPEVDVDNQFIMMATRSGVVKKTALSQFKHLRRRGIRAIILDDDDDLINAQLTNGEQHILLSSSHGMACRFHEKDVRSMGRASRGVRGMQLRGDDGKLISELVSMSAVDTDAELLVVTAKGMGKRTLVGTGIAELDQNIIGGYRLTRRGSKGVRSISLNEGDRVIAAMQLTEPEMELLMMSVKGQVVRISTDDIRRIGRAGKGVHIMRLRGDDEISTTALIAKLEPQPGDDNNDAIAAADNAADSTAADALGAAGAIASAEVDDIDDLDAIDDIDDADIDDIDELDDADLDELDDEELES